MVVSIHGGDKDYFDEDSNDNIFFVCNSNANVMQIVCFSRFSRAVFVSGRSYGFCMYTHLGTISHCILEGSGTWIVDVGVFYNDLRYNMDWAHIGQFELNMG